MGSSQKFIARNRAPRVQIEYDVELYGAQKKVQLPFVMGVMSDLSGKPKEPLPAGRRSQVPRDRRRQLRRAHEGDEAARRVPGAEHADRAKAIWPSTSRSRAWTTSRRPRSRARSSPLRKLLEARQQLANLVTYMDGKTGAEELIGKVLKDPALLKTLAAAPKPADGAQPAEGAADKDK